MEENGLKIEGPCPVISIDERLEEVLKREETLEMSNRYHLLYKTTFKDPFRLLMSYIDCWRPWWIGME